MTRLDLTWGFIIKSIVNFGVASASYNLSRVTSAIRRGFTPHDLYDSRCDSVITNYFCCKSDVGCVYMLNDWICSSDEICADNSNYRVLYGIVFKQNRYFWRERAKYV